MPSPRKFASTGKRPAALHAQSAWGGVIAGGQRRCGLLRPSPSGRNAAAAGDATSIRPWMMTDRRLSGAERVGIELVANALVFGMHRRSLHG